MIQPDSNNNIPYDKITLGSISRIGFKTGTLTKQGGIVKNWKLRYFSLTWYCLSYYEPQEPKIFISNIPLNQCSKVSSGSDEISFQLFLKDRTFVFVAETKPDAQLWIDALEAMIGINNPKIPAYPTNDLLKKIAFHIFRILHGIAVLMNTNKTLRDLAQKMNVELFALLKAYVGYILDPESGNLRRFLEDTTGESAQRRYTPDYSTPTTTPRKSIPESTFRVGRSLTQPDILKSLRASPLPKSLTDPSTPAKYSTDLGNPQRYQSVITCSTRLKDAVLKLKQGIPAEHRLLPEEVNFDIGAEDRRIRVHLKALVRYCSVIPEEQEGFVLEDIDEDIKPFVVSVIKEALVCDC